MLSDYFSMTNKKKTICIIIVLIVCGIYSKTAVLYGKIQSESMEPTLKVGAWYVATSLPFAVDHISRQDIVYFMQPEEFDEMLVKRVIGMPGEHVSIRHGMVYINGSRLNEPYLMEDMVCEDVDYTVPDDCYFMMGDNRNASYDSRNWKNPYVNKDNIVGVVRVQIYPIDQIHVFSSITYQ